MPCHVVLEHLPIEFYDTHSEVGATPDCGNWPAEQQAEKEMRLFTGLV